MKFGYNEDSSRCGETNKEHSLTPLVGNLSKTLVPRGGLIKVTLPKT
jgi:hypothetical protein